MTGALAAFLDGLASPGRAGLFGALAVALGWCGFGALAIRPSVLARLDQGWFLASDRDDYGALSHEVLRLGQARWGERTALLLGQSTARESVSSVQDLDRAAEEAAGGPVDTWELVADSLTVPEYDAILAALPDRYRGVVALIVSPTLFANANPRKMNALAGIERLELGWSSEARDRDLRELGVDVPTRTGIYAVDVRPFLLARLAVPFERVVHGPATLRRDRWTTRTRGALRKNAADLEQAVHHYERDSPVGFRMLARALDAFAARSDRVRFLLVEQTEAPERYREVMGRARYAGYRSDIRTFADARPDTQFADLNGALLPEDFADLMHLASPNAEYTRTLGAAIGSAIVAE